VLAPQQTSNGINNNNSITTKPVTTSPTHLISHQPQQSLQSTNFNNSQNPSSHLKPIVPNSNSFNQKPEPGPVPPKRLESKVSETNKVPLTSLKPLVEQSVTNMHNKDTKDLPTPSSTPTTARKTRRRSNLFPPLSNKKHLDEKYKTGEVGSGRAIPVSISFISTNCLPKIRLHFSNFQCN